MTYTIQWSSQINDDTGSYAPANIGKSTISIADNSTDDSTSITLTGKGLFNYGAYQQENYIRLMENFASENAPTNPTVGQIWFQTAAPGGTTPPVNQLWVYCVTTPGATPVLGWQPIPSSTSIANALGYTPYNPATNVNHYVTPDNTTGSYPIGNYALLLNGTTTMTGNIDAGNNRVINLASPISGTDAVNLSYLSSITSGIAWHQAVYVASTANLTLSGEQTIDGFTTSGSRVLVKDQTTQTQNGIYVSSSGAWTRAADADTTAGLNNAAVFVQNGTVWGGTAWVQTTGSPTIGTSNIIFAEIAVIALNAGTGISITGTTVSNSGVLSLTGTANNVTVSAATGNITLSLPSQLEISGLYYSGATAGGGLWLNSSGSNYGYVANTAANTWALGYSTSLGTLGTSALTWTTTGVSVVNSLGIGTSASGTAGNLRLASMNFTTGSGAQITAAPSTYGSLAVSGTTSSFAGIQFTSTTYNRTLMVFGSASEYISGFYAQSIGEWDWYFENNVLYGQNGGAIQLYGTSGAGPTTVTQPVGTNNTMIATTAFVASATDPGSSIGTNGYQKFASGLIMQWGQTSFNGSTFSVTFPVAFPHAAFSANISQPVDTSYGYALPITTLTTTGMSGGTPGTPGTLYWQAWGN